MLSSMSQSSTEVRCIQEEIESVYVCLCVCMFVCVCVFVCVCLCVCLYGRVCCRFCLHSVLQRQSLRSLAALASSAPSPVEQFRTCL